MKKTFYSSAFTLLEMIIVIVITGLVLSLGMESLVSSYENYIFTSVNNRLQSQSEVVVKQIANRLEYRIKDSVTQTATTLEWVGVDREGWLGEATTPLWSGFIDLDHPNATSNRLVSPGSDTGKLDTLISSLSNSGSGFNNSAIHFIGVSTNSVMYPIQSDTASVTYFKHKNTSFTGEKIYEYYQLSWSAYKVVHNTATKTLTLEYDYQPWEGETTGSKSQLLMRNVTSFNVASIGDVIKLQICVSDNDLTAEGEYAVCKEKTIF
jgi:prepilin-type N-terminal cleavage/methylation domain-containing protein